MKKVFLFCLLLCFLFQGVVFGQDTLRALFIGNSYTYVNDLPGMVQDLARANGDSLFVDSYTPGGYTFEAHSTDPNTLSKIAQGNWDYVVLQEQSQRPSFSPAQVAAEVFPFATTLDNAIHSADSCAETVFYMTWGRKYGDASNCPIYPPVCTYQGMQARLYDSYMQMGNTLNATVSPVGMAWKRSMAADSNINLYSGDNSHPSLEGTYLTACVFYATLFQKTPLGIPFYPGVDTTTAIYLQGIAEASVMDSFAVYHIGHRLPMPWFSWISNSLQVDFTSMNGGAPGNYLWNFGDGGSSPLHLPSHSYSLPGTYEVSLTIDDGCFAATFVDSVTVDTPMVGRNAPFLPALALFPNPGKTLRVQLPGHSGPARLQMFDLNQRLVLNQEASAGELENGVELNVQELPAGFYSLTVLVEGKRYHRSWIKQ